MQETSGSPSKRETTLAPAPVEPSNTDPTPPEKSPAAAAIKIDQQAAGSIRVEADGRRYHVRWAQPGTIEQLRVNVIVEAGENGSGRKHVETLDLYSSRSRVVFASRAARLLEVSVDAIEKDLSDILMAVDRAQNEAREAARAGAKADAAPKMTEAERTEALALLMDPNLMDRIEADLELLGYVGESCTKRLILIVATSRKLLKPLSAIIIGQSGCGKSELARVVVRLIPEEDVVFWSRLTPQALYYVERDYLTHKLVVIEEREGSDAADYAIRALQSQGKLVQAVPLKDPATGTMHTINMEVDGPAAFIETTTRLHINPENASRNFELYLDESQAQTERIHRAQRAARTPEGLKRQAQGKKLERLHQNAQRLLEPVRVSIPYTELLSFPSDSTRTRRDHDRLLNLIEAVAFLHQKQRPRRYDGAGVGDEIQATPVDYAIAYALAREAFAFGLDELRKPARDLLAVIEAKVGELAERSAAAPTAVSFTRRQAREWSGWPNHQVKLAMHELEELEYVEVERTRRGSRFSYRLVSDGGKKRVVLKGLPSPAELINLLAEQESNASKAAAVAKATVRANAKAGRRAR